MKKILCFVFVFILCLSFAACGAEKSGENISETNSETESVIITDESEKATEKKELTTTKKDVKTTAAAVDKKEWIKAYKDVLLNLDKADIDLTDQNPKFCLCYIDDNDIPELVISTGDFHAACCYVFTYVGGKAVNLGPFGEFGEIKYIDKGGIIIDKLGNNGYFVETYYKLSKGALDSPLEFEIDSRDENSLYYVDGEEISKAKYNSLVAEATGKAKIVSSPGYEKCFAVNKESVDKNLK